MDIWIIVQRLTYLEKSSAYPLKVRIVQMIFGFRGFQSGVKCPGFRWHRHLRRSLTLEDGDTVNVGEQQLSVFHCPGHTPGHVVFLYELQKIAWSWRRSFSRVYWKDRLPLWVIMMI